MGEPLVFPLGHYLGAPRPSAAGTVGHHVVRVGWQLHQLAEGEEMEVWSLAHGHPDVVGARPWTRSMLDAVAADAGMAETGEALDRLIARGVAVEVPAAGPGLHEFARAHRLETLLLGLGDVPGDPDVDGIGLLGLPPVLTVPSPTFDTWSTAHLWPDLAQAATGLAALAAGDPAAGPGRADPEAVLGRIVGEDLHRLLCRHAAYLDVRWTPAG